MTTNIFLAAIILRTPRTRFPSSQFSSPSYAATASTTMEAMSISIVETNKGEEEDEKKTPIQLYWTMILLMGMWMSLTKNPMKPMMLNPMAVAIPILLNSRRSGFVHLFTSRRESLMNS